MDTISRGGVLAHRGGFGTFGWTGTGRWNDSEAGTTYDSAAATPPAPGLPSPGRAGGRQAGQRATPEARAMARSPPPGIAALSPPSGADRQVKPRIQLEESPSGFRYKQTDSDDH